MAAEARTLSCQQLPPVQDSNTHSTGSTGGGRNTSTRLLHPDTASVYSDRPGSAKVINHGH